MKLLDKYGPNLNPGVYSNHIYHDDGCEIYKNGNCNCKPDIEIEDKMNGRIIFSLRWNKVSRVHGYYPCTLLYFRNYVLN
jgi:hypothetical protein